MKGDKRLKELRLMYILWYFGIMLQLWYNMQEQELELLVAKIAPVSQNETVVQQPLTRSE